VAARGSSPPPSLLKAVLNAYKRFTARGRGVEQPSGLEQQRPRPKRLKRPKFSWPYPSDASVASVASWRRQACERLDADANDPTATVVPFPAPAYDPDLDRFELTAKDAAYLSGAAEPRLA
jgi:hypothetical protein